MKKRLIFVAVSLALAASGVALIRPHASAGLPSPPPPAFTGVHAGIFDPGDTDTAQAVWLKGTGCLNATATHNTSNANGHYTDSVCSTAFDASDEENAGLLLEKGGPTPTFSEAFAKLQGIAKGLSLNKLGYDIRMLSYPNSTSSHCGAGAPRFEVTTTTQTAGANTTYDVGCRSPLADSSTSGIPGSGDAWTRLQWGNGSAGSVMGFNTNAGFVQQPITGNVISIDIAFDEGTDTSLDFFGAAFLDNINFNGRVVGKG